MQPVRNSVDIVNAVAAAIVTVEGRTHPPPDPYLLHFVANFTVKMGNKYNVVKTWLGVRFGQLNDCFCGTYSSFPDPETTKILDGEGDATQNLIHHHMCNGGSPFDGDITDGVPIADFSARLQPNDHAMNRRVSFELTVEGVVRCLEKKSAISRDSTTASFHFSPTSSGDHKRESNHTRAGVHDEMYHDLPEKVRRSLSLRQAREFKFNNIESTDSEANMGSDWWANEKVSEITAEPEKGMSSDPVSARVS
ncbi:hypothetical protein HU200_038183 [Digitaria exilis]|uniref:Uncharacterized protein n=1 Tax=Digitaria exilis TaxID=1010633 RepID=A0A835BC14_9POAL|nr:hypothetical protein HU200_038183 [Digitaria exilis]